jgi:hypothetical protein
MGNGEPETENCNSGSCKPGNYKLVKGKPENHDSGNYKPGAGSYRFGNGMLGNRRLRNYDPENRKPEIRNRKPGNRDVGNYDDAGSCRPEKENRGSENGSVGNRDSRDREMRLSVGNRDSELKNKKVGLRALDGYLEIFGPGNVVEISRFPRKISQIFEMHSGRDAILSQTLWRPMNGPGQRALLRPRKGRVNVAVLGKNSYL